MIDLSTTEWKFFPKDVIGKRPKAVGDTFQAKAFGIKRTFKVTYISAEMYMAVLVGA